MILIPAKMNSPDYGDFIDMFCVPTPISPLKPTPVASPSHVAAVAEWYRYRGPRGLFCHGFEPSTTKDPPYPVDSKPPNVSKSPDPPIKKAHVKKVDSVIHPLRSRETRNEERRNDERRNEERRQRDPRMYKRPEFRPPYRRDDFKPRVFRRSPYAQQLMPIFKENAQVFFYS
ncbi:hypothetical protein TNCV_3701411 [Trichonephila clavipes]|nr:hypothetical protein TNCV_3701411 [Trichonephila clavipes]